MKITDIKLFTPEDRVLVKIETNEGISGVGDAGGGRQAESMVVAIKGLARYLIGKDPLTIEHHYQLLTRHYGSAPLTAISSIEQALWDILGKSLKTPVHQLLGGRCRDRIRVYTHASTPDKALEIVKCGITAIKVDPIPGGGSGRMYVWKRFTPEMMRMAVERFGKVREAVGSKIILMAHLHQELSPAMAVEFAHKLEPYDPFWFEEPIEPTNVDALAWVAAHCRIPIATGEALHTRHEFHEVLERHAADIIQPDPIYAGGIWETRKIAAMAEPYYASYAPHQAILSLIAAFVNIQLSACVPNFVIQEIAMLPYMQWQYMIKEPLVIEEGYIKVPTKPGLGVELDEEAIAGHPAKEAEPLLGFVAYDDGTIYGRTDKLTSEEFMLHPDTYR